MSIPSLAGRSLLPSSPFIRGNMRSATTHVSQTTAPSCRRKVTTPRSALSRGNAPARLATERPEEEEQGWPEQDHEHRREDEKHQREQDLDRRLLRALLSRLAPP